MLRLFGFWSFWVGFGVGFGKGGWGVVFSFPGKRAWLCKNSTTGIECFKFS